MGDSQSFSEVADLSFTYRFGDGTNAEITQAISELGDAAGQLGLDVEMQQVGGQVRFNFQNVADMLVMRELMEEWIGNTASITHTHTLNPPDAEFQRVWADTASKTLAEAGIPHEIEHLNNRVRIHFESTAGRTMSESLANTGYFDRKARIRLDAQAPDGQIPSF